MIILINTTDKVQLVTSAAVALAVHSSFMDHTLSSDNFEAGKQNTAISTATTTDVLAAPSSGVTRNVKSLFARNDGASDNEVTVRYDANGTTFDVFKATLTPGAVLQYLDGVGFFVTSVAGRMDALLVTTADVNNDTTSWADITGLTIPVKSGVTYSFTANILYQTNATTTGARFGCNGPATPTYLRLAGIGTVTTSATAAVISTQTATVSAYDTSAIGAQTTGPGTVDSLAVIEGEIVPSADGTFAMRSQSEIAVANGVLIRRGSSLYIRTPDNV